MNGKRSFMGTSSDFRTLARQAVNLFLPIVRMTRRHLFPFGDSLHLSHFET